MFGVYKQAQKKDRLGDSMKYSIKMPIAGYVYKEIEADSEADALKKLYEEGYELTDIEECDMFEKLVEGNICYTYHTEVVIEEMD